MQLPSVTIVIAAYNAESVLSRAIQSVLRQTRPPTEIVVVDDGSEDSTASIATSFPNVTCIRQANAGPGAARNVGVAASHSTLVGFLDSDDELRPDMIELLTQALLEFPEAVAASAAHFRQVGSHRSRHPRPGAVATGPNARSLLHDYFAVARSHQIACIGSVLVRRGAFLAVGGFREDIRFGEDVDLWTRLAGRHPWAYVDHTVAVYHHTPATSATLRTPHHLKPTNWLLAEADMQRHIRQELWPSYRLYRRDRALREARTALHQGQPGAARSLLGCIAPAPLDVQWVITRALTLTPARVARFLLRCVRLARSLRPRRPA